MTVGFGRETVGVGRRLRRVLGRAVMLGDGDCVLGPVGTTGESWGDSGIRMCCRNVEKELRTLG